MEQAVRDEFTAQGGFFLSESESEKLARFILRANGTMNPQIVGKSVAQISKLAGLTNVPSTARVLIAKETRVGDDAPYSREKLAPILAFFVEENVDAVMDKVTEILYFEGMGHTFTLHCTNDELIKKFALRVPASRILVNTMGSLGGVGASTNLFPALTLGCGAVGGSSSSNNIGPMDLINIKRVAGGTKELEEIKMHADQLMGNTQSFTGNSYGNVNTELVEEIVKRIMKQLI